MVRSVRFGRVKSASPHLHCIELGNLNLVPLARRDDLRADGLDGEWLERIQARLPVPDVNLFVDVPEDEGDAPSIYVRAEHPIDYATLDRIKPANGLNVGHREFDFYAPLTDWVDAWTTAAPAEPPDAWYAARVKETTVVPAWLPPLTP